ncbi:MAG: glycosyltransferase family 4 protein [Bacteroidales bacterium]|nr:glycosyltransferase family 4 protein [Bacteroidales bacterium]
MHITYITSFDATDIRNYSGTGYYIPKMLGDSGDQVAYIGKLKEMTPAYQKIKRRLYEYRGKNYLIERNPSLLKSWGKQIQKQLQPGTDILLGYSSQPFAKLETKRPIAFWVDAVFASMIDYYEVYSNLCRESIKDGNSMEQNALSKAAVAVFSSQWAADEAARHYQVDPEKIKVVTYGANIDVPYSLQDIVSIASSKKMDTCHLLFLGIEWKRKGGDKAVEITRILNQSGIRAHLSIVGIDPGEEVKKLDYVSVYGYVSKSTPEGKALLSELISRSHFLLLPTRADCTPIVFSELNAHGVPVITTNEGGIPSIVTHGVNGFMFDKDDSPEVFSNCILEWMQDESRYTELAKSSFNEYITRLNWDVSIKKFRQILKETIG